MGIKKVCFFLLIFSTILSLPVSGLAQVDSTSEFDLKFTEFTQAANEDPTMGAIHWIGSILQQSNSRYYEGMSVCQRLIFNDIPSTPGDTHTLTLSHEATKGGVHAYDFLTSWDNAIPAADSIAPGQNLLVDLFSDKCGPEFWGSTQAICDSIHNLGLYDEADLAVLDMDSVGGHNVKLRADNYDTFFGIPRTIKIWGSDSVFSAYVTFDGYTGSADNKYANYTLHWTSASDTVIIEMAGHLSVGVDPLEAGIGYGEGFGAADISGGPYHFKLSKLDGSSLGSQDNQIKGADVLLPALECRVIPDSQAVCVGGSATFTDSSRGGTPPYSWSWTGPNGFTASTQSITINNAQLVNAGTYQVIVTDDNGLADTCYGELVVWLPPVCSIDPASAEICQGDSAEFCVVPSGGTAPYTYQWNHGPTDSCVWISTAGTYPVLVTDAKGCTTSCQATLTVNPVPSCSIEPPSAEICDGDSQKFCVAPSGGTPPYTYQWSHGPTDSCIWASDTGTYTVVVTDDKGCTTSCQATLTVHPPPDCYITGDSVICEGSTAEFCATPGMASYSWTGPGGFSASTQCTGAIGDSGYYQVVITDTNGCVDSCGRTLVVNDKPDCSITGDSVVCEGFTADFCATPGMASYTWTGPGGFSANTRCTGAIGDSGYYQVVITDTNGCVDSCGRTLVVYPQPACSIDPPSAEICQGESQEFCVIPSGGTPPYTYQWNHGPTDSCVWVSVAGLYSVVVTDAKGCANTCGRTLVVYQPDCYITGENVIPVGSTTEFCAPPGMASYSWTGPGGFSADTRCTGQIGEEGWYTVTITDENGCENTCSLKLTVTDHVSSMTRLGLVLLILAMAGVSIYLISKRRRAAA